MMKHCHNGQFMLDEGEDENVDVMGQNGNGDDGTGDDAEAQKHGWHGGITIWKVFARLESFCASGKFLSVA